MPDPIQTEAAQLTPAQQVEAATAAVNATADLANAAGPLLGAAVRVFTNTVGKSPQLFVPAVNALLSSPLPLPPPLRTQLQTIIRNAKRTPAAPPIPKTRPRTTKVAPQTPVVPMAQTAPTGMSTTVKVVAGVAAAGLVAALLLKRKK